MNESRRSQAQILWKESDTWYLSKLHAQEAELIYHTSLEIVIVENWTSEIKPGPTPMDCSRTLNFSDSVYISEWKLSPF